MGSAIDDIIPLAAGLMIVGAASKMLEQKRRRIKRRRSPIKW